MPSLPVRATTLLLVSKDSFLHDTFLSEQSATVDLSLVKEGTFGGEPAFLVFFDVELPTKNIKHFAFDIHFLQKNIVQAGATQELPLTADFHSPNRQTFLTRISRLWSGTISRLRGSETLDQRMATSGVRPRVMALGPKDLQSAPTGVGGERERGTDIEPEVGAHGGRLHLFRTGRKKLDAWDFSPGFAGATLWISFRGPAVRVVATGPDVAGMGAPRRFQVGVVIRHIAPPMVKLRYVRAKKAEYFKHATSRPKDLVDNSYGGLRSDSVTCNNTLLGRECSKNCAIFDNKHMSTKVWKKRLLQSGLKRGFDCKENDDEWVSYIDAD